MTSATAVFTVTNYWEYLDQATEIAQGRNLVDAAVAANVAHFIWSSLPHVSRLTGGEITKVFHFDAKAEVEEYARSKKNLGATFFHAGGFMSNFVGEQLKPDERYGGAWTLAAPMAREAVLPVFETGDTRVFVKAAVLNREKVLGKRLLGATEYVSHGDLVGRFAKVFPEAGKTARYVHLGDEEFISKMVGGGMAEWVAEELLENYWYTERYGYFFGEGLDETHALLAPEDRLTTWEEHLRANPKAKDLK